MTLQQNDLEIVERIIRRTCDDISISVDRSIERIEERVDAMETRIYSRMADLEDMHHDTLQTVCDILDALKEDIRDLSRSEY